MPNRVTGKQKAQRIEFDYYKRRDPILRAKVGLSVLALIVALAWWGAGLQVRGGRLESSAVGNLRYSKGTLASVHQTWDAKCEACHLPFNSIDAHRWTPPLIARGGSDHLCQSCHKGPAHSGKQIAGEVKSCAGCHVDHRGREASLLRLNDTECTTCHANLGSHRLADVKKEKTVTAEQITSFATDHPPFSTEAAGFKDSSGLKFNHKRHLNPGLVAEVGERDGKTLRWLADADRARYQKDGQEPDALITLECKSCHVTDASDFRVDRIAGVPQAAVLPPRASGAQMLPITFENQCKACHPLTFDSRSPELVVPHRVQPAEIDRFLSDLYAGMYLKQEDKLLDRRVGVRTNPGLPPDPAEVDVKKKIDDAVKKAESRIFRPYDSAEVTVKQKIDGAVKSAERVLFEGKTTCLECHNAVINPGQILPESIVVPKVPTIWQEKAFFDHTAHRSLGADNCNVCHSQARTSDDATDVLLPKLSSCQVCHAPASSAADRGGVRHDCTTCHRYHNGDHTTQGRGALAEWGAIEKDVRSFLTGDGAQKDREAPPPH
jgi:hypothetical protein